MDLRSNIILHGVGGAGINIAKDVIDNYEFELLANLSVSCIDSTDKTVQSYPELVEEFFRIESSKRRDRGLDGSGGERKSPELLKQYAEAVKAYIYNVSDIKGKIQAQFGGTELTPFQNRISDYSGAEKEYQELLATKWGKVTLMEDGQTHEKLMRLQLTGVLDRSEVYE